MAPWDGTDEPIGEIAVLKRQDERDYALDLLQRVYRFVIPIMRKRKFKVGKLVEFMPKNPRLLGVNVNHGQRISLRLRYAHNPRQFMPFESILGTMLHELCHNRFGPHDEKFFRLLLELEQELEDMRAKGFNGDPFTDRGTRLGSLSGGVGMPLDHKQISGLIKGPGNRLGGQAGVAGPARASSAPPTERPYNRPMARTQERLVGSRQKLGGSRTIGSRTLRERALAAAEQRREADDICKTADRESQLSPDERGEVIDLTDEVDEPPGSESNRSESNRSDSNRNEKKHDRKRHGLEPPDPKQNNLEEVIDLAWDDRPSSDAEIIVLD